MAELRELSITKGAEVFCFRYEAGEEVKVLDAMIDLVNQKTLKFDWFDAAILSHQLGRHLARELKKTLPRKAA